MSDLLRIRFRRELQRLLQEIGEDPSLDLERRRQARLTILKLMAALTAEDSVWPEILQKRYHFPTLEEHYGRNQFMPIEEMPQSPEQALEWGWSDKVASDCHQFTSPDRSNIKFVSQDGKSEVIFDSQGKIVTASEDYGTYNFADSRTDPAGHFYMDVLPWLIWGNDEKDTTDQHQRMRTFIVYGGANAVAGALSEGIPLQGLSERKISVSEVVSKWPKR